MGLLSWFRGERRVAAGDIKPGDRLIMAFYEWRVREVKDLGDDIVSVRCGDFTMNVNRKEKYLVQRAR